MSCSLTSIRAFPKKAIQHPAALALPRAFLYCTEDKELMATGAAIISAGEMALTDSAWRYFEMHTDHLPSLNQPRELADILLSLAAEPARPVVA